MYCNPSGRLRQGPPVDPASGIPLGQISVQEGPPCGELDPRVRVDGDNVVVRKTATDGFFRAELAEQLADLDVDTIIVTVIGTDFCVAMTRPLAPWLVRVRAAEDGALWAPPAGQAAAVPAPT
jgi:Isochorismatase family